MTDTVSILAEAFKDHQLGAAAPGTSLFEFMAKRLAAASPQEAVPTKREAALADLAKLDGETMDLAASPQGEGSSGEWITHDGGPNPVPGKRAFYRYFALGDQSDPLETTQALPSDLQDWEWPGHTAGAYDDIIAYRVTEGVRP